MSLDSIDKTALDLINGVGCAGGCASAVDIADAMREAVKAERVRVLNIASGLLGTPAYEVFKDRVESGATSAW